MPPPRYALHDTLKLDVDGLSDQFKLPNVVIYRAMCDVLEEDGRVSEAIECFHQLQSKLGGDTKSIDETVCQWVASEDSVLSLWSSVPSEIAQQTSRCVISRHLSNVEMSPWTLLHIKTLLSITLQHRPSTLHRQTF